MEIGQRQFIEDVCRSFENPVVLLDGDLRCVYCNREGFFEKGRLLATVLLTEIKRPITKGSKAMASINGIKYSIRLMPFCDDFLFCEFFDLQEVYELAEYSDLYEKVKTYTKSIDMNVIDLWKKSDDLENYQRQIPDEGLFDRILLLKKALNSLNSNIHSLSDVVSMLFERQDPRPIFVNKLLKELIDRCNSLLSNCGRAINFEYEAIREYFILSNERHALVALINAIQNALLYSPADCIPTVVLSSVLEKDKRYVLLKVINDDVYFVNEKNGDRIDRNFVFQRAGLGIPIIKSFVEECDGIFSMKEVENKVVVEIKIPEYIPHNINECILESPGTIYYKTDIPDIIEIKMTDVINSFAKKNP